MAGSLSAATRAIKKFRVENLPRQQVLSRAPTTQKNVQQPQVEAINPFLPRQDALGKWHKPRYSMRMQKELLKKAQMSGTVGLLPPGPKFSVHQIQAAQLPENITLKAEKRPGWWIRPVQWRTEPVRTKSAPEPSVQTPTGSTASEEEIEKQNKLRLRQERVVARAKRRKLVREAKKAGLVTLYVGRKKMFKGHKWERTRAERHRKHRIAMLTMGKRVIQYKSYYRRRRPSPLAAPRAVSTKLPF